MKPYDHAGMTVYGVPLEEIGDIISVMKEAGVQTSADLAERLHVGEVTLEVVDVINTGRRLGTLKFNRSLVKNHAAVFKMLPRARLRADNPYFGIPCEYEAPEVVTFHVHRLGGKLSKLSTASDLDLLTRLEGFTPRGVKG